MVLVDQQVDMQKIPRILITYFQHIQHMLNSPDAAALDNMRAELHDELCARYGITKEQSRVVTDNLFNYNGIEAHAALVKIATEAAR